MAASATFFVARTLCEKSGAAVATQSQTNKRGRTNGEGERPAGSDLHAVRVSEDFRRISRTRLYEAIKSGEIKTIRDRKRRIIEIEEGKRWVRSLAENTEQSSAA